MTSIDTFTSSTFTAPEMPVISPTTSNDASTSSADADELITTPRRSLDDPSAPASGHASALAPSPQIVGLPTPGSGPSKPRFNFASLNKLNKTPPSPGGPKFDGPSPPSSPTLAPSSPPRKAASAPYSRPAPAPAAPAIQALRPMTPANPQPQPNANPKICMPKSQPLSRALFTKLSENGSGAGLGLGSKKVAKSQKLIVPKKSFQTTFELSLTSSEFARR